MARTRLFLVRHGERSADHAGLSPLGRQQADRLGHRLGRMSGTVPFTAVHHSPLPRAAETADLLAGHLPGVSAHVCDHVADRTPVPSAARRAEYPTRWHPWLDTVPDDERDEDAVALRAAVAHLGVTGAVDRDDLLVTHAFVIGWFVRHVLDAPEWRWIGLNHDNCGLTVLEWTADRPPTLVTYNDTGHLVAG